MAFDKGDDSAREFMKVLGGQEDELNVQDPKPEVGKGKEGNKGNKNEEEGNEDYGDEGDEGNEEGDEGGSEEGKEKLESKADKFIEIPKFKEITKKYPDLFKDFPHLRHTFFHAKEYREIFPTIEDAKEAVESLENFQVIQDALSTGGVEGTAKVLESIKNLGEDTLTDFASNFLDGIKKSNQDLYYQVITPELVGFTRSLYNAGVRNSNENLKNTALQAALHFFGDTKVASGEKEIKLPGKEDKKDSKLDDERKSFQRERYSAFYNDVVNDADTKVENYIKDGLDPKDIMSDGMKDLVTEKVMKDITKTLNSNTAHVSRMNSLWLKAQKDNFSGSWKTKIISAYLEAAKEIMPGIRSKVRANVLGIRDRHSENQSRTAGGKRVEPQSNVGGGRRSSSNGNDIDPKKVNWKKTSDLDFLRGNVTTRG